jgi:anti-sigma regulatory factor (Ser/Thr protein kinase)
MREDGARLSTLALPATSSAAKLARQHVAAIGAAWPDDLRDVALLLTSELVTNALRYGNGAIYLTVQQTPDTVRIEIQDANPTTPQMIASRDTTGERGRGLHIVDRLATRWGKTPTARPPGKTVWFELDTRPGNSPPSS